jgi:vitamin K-dependent gamma-carboxylase
MIELRTLRARLVAPTDVAALVAFRILLGVLVSVSAARFLAYGWVDELFVKPTFFFKYFGFSWVRVLPAPGMHVVFGAMVMLGAFFAAGLAYRVVAPLLFVLFSYVQLIDVTNWLNHYYLVSLLLLLSSFMPLGRAGSLDSVLRPGVRLSQFPAWCTYLLRFQIGVVYVGAGLAKLSSDWLVHAQPLNIWLSSRTSTPVLGSLFDERIVAYAFSWGGFLFDTTIPFFLAWRRTRLVAYGVVLGFHATVGMLFPIGMFPFIMTGAALVFFSPSWPRRLLRAERSAVPSQGTGQTQASTFALRPWGIALAGVYAVFQLVMPMRTHLYGGNVLWHEQGMRMSWRVMVREKNSSVTYRVKSASSPRTLYVEPRSYLTDRQARELEGQPDLIVQLAHHIADDFRGRGMNDVEVYVDAIASLNGRAGARLIDEHVDLTHLSEGLRPAPWILPAPDGPPIHLRSAWRSRRVAMR